MRFTKLIDFDKIYGINAENLQILEHLGVKGKDVDSITFKGGYRGFENWFNNTFKYTEYDFKDGIYYPIEFDNAKKKWTKKFKDGLMISKTKDDNTSFWYYDEFDRVIDITNSRYNDETLYQYFDGYKIKTHINPYGEVATKKIYDTKMTTFPYISDECTIHIEEGKIIKNGVVVLNLQIRESNG